MGFICHFSLILYIFEIFHNTKLKKKIKSDLLGAKLGSFGSFDGCSLQRTEINSSLWWVAQGAPWKGKETKLSRRPRGFHPRDLNPWLTESSKAELLHPLEEWWAALASESRVFLTRLNWEHWFGRSQLSKKEYIYFFK